jgi:hypothetical protein
MNQDTNILLAEKVIESEPVFCKGVNLKDEVWNPKSSHFLDFEHFADSESKPGGLITTTKVTHGFKINRNRRMYAPKELKRAATDAFDLYPPPVKENHTVGMGDDGAVIGRAVKLAYVAKKDNSPMIAEANRLSPRDKAFHKLTQDAYKGNFFKNPNNGGAGYLEGVSRITDKDAIVKILDGRLMTVSVEMMTRQWLNPALGEAWDYDMMQKYHPGQIDDEGRLHFLLATDLEMEGWAYVCHPADKEATTISTIQDNVRDAFKEANRTPTFYFGDLTSLMVKDSIIEEINYNLQGEGTMNLSKLKTSIAENAVDVDSFTKELYGDKVIKEDVPSSLLFHGIPVVTKDALGKIQSEMGEDTKLTTIETILDVYLSEGKSERFFKETVTEPAPAETKAEDADKSEPAVFSVDSLTEENLTAIKAKYNLEVVNDSLKAELTLVQDKVKELEAKIATDADKVAKVEKLELKVTILRDEVNERLEESFASKSVLKQAIEDHIASLESFVPVLEAITGKEVSISEDNFNLSTLKPRFKEILDALDLESITKKINTLGKEPVTEVNDSTENPKEEDAIEYNNIELNAARQYTKIKDQRGSKAALGFWINQKKAGNVRREVELEEILKVNN